MGEVVGLHYWVGGLLPPPPKQMVIVPAASNQMIDIIFVTSQKVVHFGSPASEKMIDIGSYTTK
jgi:hypothetical protein